MPPINHHRPPNSGSKIKALGYGITASSIFSALFATVLNAAGVPVTVILPTTAPIWVGTAMLLFMTLKG